MTFDTYEMSIEDSAPIELFTFTFATGPAIRYASGSRNVAFRAQRYNAAPVRRSPLQIVSGAAGGTEQDVPSVTIEMTAADPVIARFVGQGMPLQTLQVSIARLQPSIPDTERITSGYATQVAFRNDHTAVLTIALKTDAPLGLALPKFVLSRTCNHVLYDRFCTVTRVPVDATVVAIAGRVITIGSADRALAIVGSKAFVFGDVQHTGSKERRTVVDMNIPVSGAKTITLDIAWPTAVLVGDALTLFLGCKHTVADCRDTFNNVPNFGGHPHILDASQFAKVTKSGAV